MLHYFDLICHRLSTWCVSAQVANMLKTRVQVRKPNSVKGGVGGIGKTARSHLKQIKKGKETFHSVFNTANGKFLIARKGGKTLVKTGMYRCAVGMILKSCLQDNKEIVTIAGTTEEPMPPRGTY